MVRCSFCENVIKPATGKMYVKKDGKILYFCTNKCEKNMLKLKRKPSAQRWTKAAAAKKGGKK
ncbi:MAG: 50S ribosomal protein L24e [Nanoarchaeota archaeon]|nr:50S ribosomal protein L24e [Nanoarchaeota archaeon]